MPSPTGINMPSSLPREPIFLGTRTEANNERSSPACVLRSTSLKSNRPSRICVLQSSMLRPDTPVPFRGAIRTPPLGGSSPLVLRSRSRSPHEFHHRIESPSSPSRHMHMPHSPINFAYGADSNRSTSPLSLLRPGTPPSSSLSFHVSSPQQLHLQPQSTNSSAYDDRRRVESLIEQHLAETLAHLEAIPNRKLVSTSQSSLERSQKELLVRELADSLLSALQHRTSLPSSGSSSDLLRTSLARKRKRSEAEDELAMPPPLIPSVTSVTSQATAAGATTVISTPSPAPNPPAAHPSTVVTSVNASLSDRPLVQSSIATTLQQRTAEQSALFQQLFLAVTLCMQHAFTPSQSAQPAAASPSEPVPAPPPAATTSPLAELHTSLQMLQQVSMMMWSTHSHMHQLIDSLCHEPLEFTAMIAQASSAASRTANPDATRGSCHQCHSKKDNTELFRCMNSVPMARQKLCRRRYCAKCLQRYHVDLNMLNAAVQAERTKQRSMSLSEPVLIEHWSVRVCAICVSFSNHRHPSISLHLAHILVL